ncbi:MAG: hypothetical protein QOE75_964, partial [Solirubrobacterales bacterium]|nr:hypothetical protein [Solirubrobacterales bacterium]
DAVSQAASRVAAAERRLWTALA